METVLDVVIAFKGECDYMSAYEFIFLGRDGEFIVDGQANASLRNQKMFVCTGDKVSGLVDELASNFGKCDISYQKHCSNEVIRLEGNEMKTVTHEGNVYQIGAVYEFSNDGKSWFPGRLHGLDGTGCYSATCGEYSRIRLQQAPIGTITEAPVELVDGEWYLVKKEWGSKETRALHRNNGAWFYDISRYPDKAEGEYTAIKLLTVEK